MAKKTNRPKAKPKAATKPPVKAEIEQEATAVAPAPTPAAEPRVPKTPKVSRSQVAAERIEDEYAYITDDLRRVFILAAAMFALLIVLNIVIGMVG